MGNHVQEMWMAPFTLWAVVAMSHARWVWIGGVLTVAAALFKGPQGLFPLVWLPLLGGLGLVPRTEVVRRFGIVLATVLALAVGLWFWDDAREAILRNAGNRLVRTFTQDRAITTADRMWLLGPMLGQWVVLLGSALVVAWVRFGLFRATLDRRAFAMLALGLGASLPLMVTQEQRDFYLITSLGFVALGLGNALGGTKVVRRPRFAVAVGVIAMVGLSSMPWRRVERDSELRASLAMFKEEFAPRSAFNAAPELRLNHELAAYAMRHYRWEVDLANEREHANRIELDSATEEAVVLRPKSE
jgi:hypothetical protein